MYTPLTPVIASGTVLIRRIAFWVQHIVDFQDDVSILGRLKTRTTGNQLLVEVLNEAAHRGESERFVCFR